MKIIRVGEGSKISESQIRKVIEKQFGPGAISKVIFMENERDRKMYIDMMWAEGFDADGYIARTMDYFYTNYMVALAKTANYRIPRGIPMPYPYSPDGKFGYCKAPEIDELKLKRYLAKQGVTLLQNFTSRDEHHVLLSKSDKPLDDVARMIMNYRYMDNDCKRTPMPYLYYDIDAYCLMRKYCEALNGGV